MKPLQTPNPSINADDIRPIREAVEIPVPAPETSAWPLVLQVLIAVFVLVAIVLLVLWLRRRIAANRVPNLRKKSLKQLDAIRSLMKPETSREYAIEVSNILRHFIEERFHLPSTRQTSEEFLRELTTNGNEDLGVYQNALSNFFRQCDLGKFAAQSLSEEDMRVLESSARDVIESECQPSTPKTQ